MIVLQSTRDVAFNGIKCLVYGPPKVGKTVLIATAPSPVILSAEQGLLSLRHLNLPYIPIKTLSDLQEAYQWALQSQEARQFATIGIDSVSEIVENLLAVEKTKTRDPRKAYGEILEKGVSMIKDFRDLPGRNVVMIAKQERSQDEASGVMFHQPSFPGQKLGPAVPYYPDEIFQYCMFTDPQSKQTYRALRCQPDHQNVAGDRSGALNEFEPPNLTHIFNKIVQKISV